MGNFLYAYPTFDGKTEQEVDEFIDMITDHIVYNE
jgi:cell division septum initiation protein DivIVA